VFEQYKQCWKVVGQDLRGFPYHFSLDSFIKAPNIVKPLNFGFQNLGAGRGNLVCFSLSTLGSESSDPSGGTLTRRAQPTERAPFSRYLSESVGAAAVLNLWVCEFCCVGAVPTVAA
jgi:hypothetical protein